jgi:hypothetical protein
VTGVAWEDARDAGDADSQSKLEGIQRRHHSERRALEGTAHTAQSGHEVAASANLGGPQDRARPPPVTQQRTPHVDTLVNPGCYLDETLPFSLLPVGQLNESGTTSHLDFTRRELHFLDCPGFLDADPRPRTAPMNSEGGLYNLRLTPQLRLITQANSGGPPPPGTELKEPMRVLAGVRGTVDWQPVRSCVQIRRTLRERTRRFRHELVY